MASWLGKPGVKTFEDVYVAYLPLNYAYVFINSTLKSFGVYSVREDCYKCPFERIELEDSHSYLKKTPKFQVNTGNQYTWRILPSAFEIYIAPDYKRNMVCEMKPALSGFGVYRLNVDTCTLKTEVQPANVYTPLLLFSLLLLSSFITFGLIKLFLRRRNNEAKCNDGLKLTTRRDNLDVMPSLHFLRGVLLILMIFVTTGGGGYPIFSKNFGGLTLGEGLFLIFALTIGLHVPTMVDEEIKKAKSRCSIFGLILARSVFICILGMAISQVAPRSRFIAVPIWAPLARIAFTYLVSATVYMFCVRRYGSQVKDILSKASAGVASLLWSWVLAIFLLVLMTLSIQVFYYLNCNYEAGATATKEKFTLWDFQDQCQARVFGEVFAKNSIDSNRDEPLYIESYNIFTKGLLGMVLLILMIFVTTGGGGYPIFSKNFGGLTLGEGLFLIFALTIGLHVPTMVDEEIKKAKSRCSIFGLILARSVFICILGMAISQVAPRSRFIAVPIWAPLARIAFTYLVSATVYMFCVRRYGSQVKDILSKASAGVASLLWSWVLAIFLLVLMTLSIQVFYYLNCNYEAGATATKEKFTLWDFQDQCQARVFGEVFAKNSIDSNRDEPLYIESYNIFTKGLLGIITSVLMALAGLKVGVILIEDMGHFEKIKQWLCWATALGGAGFVIAAISTAIKFNLWPIATIFLFSSLTIFIYTVTFYFTDVRKVSCSTITSCGVAFIATFSCHLLFSQTFPFHWGMHFDNHFSYLCQSTWIVVLWVVLTVCWMKWRLSLVTRMVANEETRRAVLSW